MLGKLLVRSVTRDLAGDIFGGLGRAAAFGAGAVLVSEVINNVTNKRVPATAGNYVPVQNQAQMQGSNATYYANVALARIAL